ncbi:hypothetical protein ACFL4A_03600 [bacterium]
MNLIKHTMEPTRLLLTWKDKANSRLLIIAEILRENDNAKLTYLASTEDFKKAQENGFKYFPAFPDINKIHTVNVMEIFSRRIPPKQREDYNEFLQEIRLPKDVNISNFALLGYSEVKLPSDGFAIINPFDNVESNIEFLTEIAGFRHYPKAVEMLNEDELRISLPVNIEIEDTNKYDKLAVKAMLNNEKIGNINRVQNKAFRRWIHKHKKISAQIEKINGTPERPSIILFIKVEN